ncbi:hypothetical protein AVEN_57567-1 [Araneus ventricosus]|uniref:Uncharacterized protein n=1 Tax=Araneus ventricosus TaxID=182803 RepID=A0A4Y2KKE2_ARAVE|nr:hypothetical protein AVEN_57567-1 [Araneus ventricosus]
MFFTWLKFKSSSPGLSEDETYQNERWFWTEIGEDLQECPRSRVTRPHQRKMSYNIHTILCGFQNVVAASWRYRKNILRGTITIVNVVVFLKGIYRKERNSENEANKTSHIGPALLAEDIVRYPRDAFRYSECRT